MKTTLYTFNLKFNTWYIDYNSEPGLQNPYSVYTDENYKTSLPTLALALEYIITRITVTDWYKKY